MPGAGVPARLVLLGTGTHCEMTAAAAAVDLTDRPTGSLSLSWSVWEGTVLKLCFCVGVIKTRHRRDYTNRTMDTNTHRVPVSLCRLWLLASLRNCWKTSLSSQHKQRNNTFCSHFSQVKEKKVLNCFSSQQRRYYLVCFVQKFVKNVCDGEKIPPDTRGAETLMNHYLYNKRLTS